MKIIIIHVEQMHTTNTNHVNTKPTSDTAKQIHAIHRQSKYLINALTIGPGSTHPNNKDSQNHAVGGLPETAGV